MENAIKIYESLSRPPATALKEIKGGKLSGKTDINPQWRYKAMTEKFGLVGIGWKYEVQKLWTEQGANNDVLAFAQVAVLIKDGDKWSEPIVGIGGSKLVQKENGAPVSNDEGYKMAVTDAFSTALKMLGVAADIYAGMWDGSKYKDVPTEEPKKQQQQPQQQTQQPPQKQPKKKVELKGGDSTPEERQRIVELYGAKYPNGHNVFSKEELDMYSRSRATERTAIELIIFVESCLRNRRPDAPELPENKNQEIIF